MGPARGGTVRAHRVKPHEPAALGSLAGASGSSTTPSPHGYGVLGPIHTAPTVEGLTKRGRPDGRPDPGATAVRPARRRPTRRPPRPICSARRDHSPTRTSPRNWCTSVRGGAAWPPAGHPRTQARDEHDQAAGVGEPPTSGLKATATVIACAVRNTTAPATRKATDAAALGATTTPAATGRGHCRPSTASNHRRIDHRHALGQVQLPGSRPEESQRRRVGSRTPARAPHTGPARRSRREGSAGCRRRPPQGRRARAGRPPQTTRAAGHPRRCRRQPRRSRRRRWWKERRVTASTTRTRRPTTVQLAGPRAPFRRSLTRPAIDPRRRGTRGQAGGGRHGEHDGGADEADPVDGHPPEGSSWRRRHRRVPHPHPAGAPGEPHQGHPLHARGRLVVVITPARGEEERGGDDDRGGTEKAKVTGAMSGSWPTTSIWSRERGSAHRHRVPDGVRAPGLAPQHRRAGGHRRSQAKGLTSLLMHTDPEGAPVWVVDATLVVVKAPWCSRWSRSRTPFRPQ